MAKSTVKKPVKPAKTVTKSVKEVNDEKIQQPTPETIAEVDAEMETMSMEFDKFLDERMPDPSDFLTSKGFTQYHEGQNINATFEQVQELLKEYRAL